MKPSNRSANDQLDSTHCRI